MYLKHSFVKFVGGSGWVEETVHDALRRSAPEREAHGGPATVSLHVASAERQVSRVLLSMSHTFEKFEPDSYWFGVYLLTVRLLETSMLVFFKKRTTKAMVATAVSVMSLLIAQKCKPWLLDADDKVRRQRALALLLYAL